MPTESILHRSISRRSALAAAGVAGLALPLINCAGDDDSPAAPTKASSTSQNANPTSQGVQPKRGGKATTEMPAVVSNLDPHQTIETISAVAWRLGGNGFFRQKRETNEVEPDLIAKWELPDALTVTLKVQQNVKWHNKGAVNGRALTADDIAYSLTRIGTADPAFKRASLMQSVDSVKVLDSATVQLKLKSPFVGLVNALAGQWNVVVPKEVVEASGDLKKWENVIGTGPFMLKEGNPTSGATFVRNPDYWRQGKPYLDEVEIKIITDPSARDAAFRSGQTDLHVVPATDLALWKGEKSFRIDSVPTSDFTARVVGGQVDRAPLNDPRVRKAIDLALDRDDIVRAIQPGVSAVIAGQYAHKLWAIPETELRVRPGYRKDKAQDLAEAKKLLEAAGQSNLSFDVITTQQFPTFYITPLEAVTAQLKKVGITLKPQVMEYGQLIEKNQKRDFAFTVQGLGVGNSDPNDSIATLFEKTGSRNHWGFNDPKYDEMAVKQRGILDAKERVKYVQDMERYLLDTIPVSFHMFYTDGYAAVANRLKGFVLLQSTVQGPVRGHEFEDVWIDG